MTKNKANYSITGLLKGLWKEGYFFTVKDISEISKTIAAKGFHSSISSISVALIRLVRSGDILHRTKIQRKWKYIQKYPASSSPHHQTDLFTNYKFHPHIKHVALQQFKDGYFKEAILNAFVEVVDQVKIKTGYPKNSNGRDIDGDDLMNRIFGCDNQEPIIKFNSLQTSLDKAEQRGI